MTFHRCVEEIAQFDEVYMLVSVVLPVYNRESTIKKAIESILEQSFQDFEIIAVDDCSTDNSVEEMRKIADKRLRIIQCEKNGGACIARNRGIDAAQGTYIAFQDSDDEWHKDKLEKNVQALKERDVDFVFSALTRIGEKGFKDNVRKVPFYDLNKEENPLQKLLYLNCVSTQTIVAKKSVFEKVRFDDRLPRFQDWDLAIQMLKAGCSFYYMDEALVDCYVLDDSVTSDAKKAYRATKIFEEKYKEDLEKDPKAYREFYERAAYRYEEAGENGAQCFLNAYKIDSNKVLYTQYLLAKCRLYRPFSIVKGWFVKKR